MIVSDSNPYIPGAETVTSLWRYTTYGDRAELYTGYLPVRNYIGEVTVKNNRIAVTTEDSEYNDALIVMRYTVGITLHGNRIASTVSFTECDGGVEGVLFYNCMTGADAYTRLIQMKPFDDTSIAVLLENTTGPIRLTASTALTLTLGTDGNGSLLLRREKNGSLSVECAPNEGYVFAGWVVRDSGAEYGANGDVTLSAPLALTAVFRTSDG